MLNVVLNVALSGSLNTRDPAVVLLHNLNGNSMLLWSRPGCAVHLRSKLTLHKADLAWEHK